MVRRAVIVMLLLVLFASPVAAFDEWSKREIGMQVIASLLIITDWGQTRTIAKNPDRWYEKNPILGRHPSVAEVDRYFIACLIGNVMITHILPEKWRETWLGITIGCQAYCVGNNFSLGVTISF